MTWNQFQAIPNGTQVFNHGWDQCVALANLYQESVLGQPFVAVGSAYQWWTLFRNYPALYNTYKQSGVPIAGAVVVSRYGIYDAPNGHIEVVTSVNSDGSFNTMGQNASGHRYVWRYRRTMQNILGFLHPYNNPANPKPARQEEDDDMQSIIVDGVHLFAVSSEFISHHGTEAQANITRNVMSATDELHKLSTTQFMELLDGLDIPRNVVKAGSVLNPQSGALEVNGTWSRSREILAALSKK